MNAHNTLFALAEKFLAERPTSNLYFLLDHAGLRGLHKLILRSSVTWVSLFDGAKETNALDVAPILVLVVGQGQFRISRSLFNWIEENGICSSTIILISSDLSIAPLKDRLALRLDVVLSENIEAMLRFFDPRVLESLERILTDEEADRFFSVADEWCYFDREGKARVIESNFRFEEKFISPLVLNQKQESNLLEANEIDQILNLLRTSLPESMASLSWPEQYKFVGGCMDKAKQYDLKSVWEIAIYAAIVLLNPEDFSDEEKLSKVIVKLKRGDYDLLAVP